jgi:integrase
MCHRRQAVKNKLCCECKADLVQLKKQKEKVKYWIQYRLPGGKQRKEYVGYSIEEARDAEGKRRTQKRENRIFDILPQAKMTFNELAEWYLNRPAVKALSSHDRVRQTLFNFNQVFGEKVVNSIKPDDLEHYQELRITQGRAPSTVDMELRIAKTMVNKALDNDMIDGKTLKAFRCVKRKLKTGANARTRTLSVEEFQKLLEAAPSHLKPILTVAYNTGMRSEEIWQLKWSFIDREREFIRLPAEVTKASKARVIPINSYVAEVLRGLPRTLRVESVFTYKGKPYTSKSAFKRSFKTGCRKAGIIYGRDNPEGVIFHDLRRTVKTNMLAAGVEKVYRDLIVGHSLQGMDVHYLAPSDQDLKRAMEQFTSWMKSQLDRATDILSV